MYRTKYSRPTSSTDGGLNELKVQFLSATLVRHGIMFILLMNSHTHTHVHTLSADKIFSIFISFRFPFQYGICYNTNWWFCHATLILYSFDVCSSTKCVCIRLFTFWYYYYLGFSCGFCKVCDGDCSLLNSLRLPSMSVHRFVEWQQILAAPRPIARHIMSSWMTIRYIFDKNCIQCFLVTGYLLNVRILTASRNMKSTHTHTLIIRIYYIYRTHFNIVSITVTILHVQYDVAAHILIE